MPSRTNRPVKYITKVTGCSKKQPDFAYRLQLKGSSQKL